MSKTGEPGDPPKADPRAEARKRFELEALTTAEPALAAWLAQPSTQADHLRNVEHPQVAVVGRHQPEQLIALANQFGAGAETTSDLARTDALLFGFPVEYNGALVTELKSQVITELDKAQPGLDDNGVLVVVSRESKLPDILNALGFQLLQRQALSSDPKPAELQIFGKAPVLMTVENRQVLSRLDIKLGGLMTGLFGNLDLLADMVDTATLDQVLENSTRLKAALKLPADYAGLLNHPDARLVTIGELFQSAKDVLMGLSQIVDQVVFTAQTVPNPEPTIQTLSTQFQEMYTQRLHPISAKIGSSGTYLAYRATVTENEREQSTTKTV